MWYCCKATAEWNIKVENIAESVKTGKIKDENS